MAIVNISLLLNTSEGLQNGLQGVIAKGFTLTDYTDGTGVPAISVGRTEEIAGALYRVETEDFEIDVTGVTGDGTYYVYIEDTGSGVVAFADDTVPTWRGDLGGFYLSGSTAEKAVFRFLKSGSNYIHKQGIIQNVTFLDSVDLTPISGNEIIAISSDWAFKTSLQDSEWYKSINNNSSGLMLKYLATNPEGITYTDIQIEGGSDYFELEITGGTWEISYEGMCFITFNGSASGSYQSQIALSTTTGDTPIDGSRFNHVFTSSAGDTYQFWVSKRFIYVSPGNVTIRLCVMPRIISTSNVTEMGILGGSYFGGGNPHFYMYAKRLY
jgi:hypothetical protein